MHDLLVYVKLDKFLLIDKQIYETISQNPMFETVKFKVIISVFESVGLSVSISQRNLYNSSKK